MKRHRATFTVFTHLFVLCLVILGASNHNVSAKSAFLQGHQFYKQYGAEQGLTNLAAWDIIQDHHQFIWVATEAGLFRYDGNQFKLFDFNHGLPSNNINALYEDMQGDLWVGTENGVVVKRHQRFETVGLPNLNIAKITGNSEGQVWIASENGLYGRSGDGWSLVAGWGHGEASTVHFGKHSQRLYTAMWKDRAEVGYFYEGTWFVIEGPEELKRNRIDSIVEDKQGRVWARASRGLWVLEPGETQFKQAVTPIEIVGTNGYMNLGRHGDVWVPTDHGILHYRNEQWRVMSTETGLPSPWSRVVLEDHEGSIWIGGLGVSRLIGRGVWHAYTSAEGLNNEIIWHIFRDQKQTLWVATDEGLYFNHSDSWQRLNGTEHFSLRTSAQTPDGRYILGGYPVDELLVVNPISMKIEKHPVSFNVKPSRIYRLLIDEQNSLWVATAGAGLWKSSVSENIDLVPVALPQAEGRYNVTDIKLDNSGRVWAATSLGLYILQGGQWHRFDASDGLMSKKIAGLVVRSNGSILISYIEPVGLTEVNFKNNTLDISRHITASEGLPATRIYQIGEDINENIWVGSGQGAFLFSKGQVAHFGQAEGLVSEDCNNMAFWAEPNGDVWIGTSGGLARFESKAYLGLIEAPDSEFLSINLGGKDFNEMDNIVTPFDANTLTVGYTGLSFVNENKVTHRIKLQGLDSEWLITSNHTARYPVIPQGSYLFSVSSRVGDGHWGPISSFKMKILPAWWQTVWFKIVFITVLIASVALLLKWRSQTLQKRNLILETQVRARTAALKEANNKLEKVNIALQEQSLTDPLTGLRNRRYLNVYMPEYVAQVDRHYKQLSKHTPAQVIKDRNDILLVMIDIDHFKSVNDKYGHKAGDLVLKQFAETLMGVTRDGDSLIRWGGEEFLVVARNTSEKDYISVVERIVKAVNHCRFDLGNGHRISRTCSLGFAHYPMFANKPNTFSWEQTVNLADRCLYIAKQGGRNAWVGLVGVNEQNSQKYQNIAQMITSKQVKVASSIKDLSHIDWSEEEFI